MDRRLTSLYNKMMEHSDRNGGARTDFGSVSELDDLVIVAVLEDSKVLKQEIKTTLESRAFLVLTPESKDDCLELLSRGCQTFVLDIGLDEMARRVEGLNTLEDIKRELPSAFCAVITHQDKDKYKPIAENLGADWFSGKTGGEIKALIKRIEIEFLRRRFSLPSEPTLFDIGLQARRENRRSLDSARSLLAEIRESAETILHSLSEGDRSRAEDQLVLLEPDIRRLLSFKDYFGDGYGIVVSALWNALVNQPGAGISEQQIACWLDVLETTVRIPPNVEESVTLVDRLESVGFDPDPPGIEDLLELLIASGGNEVPLEER